MKQIGIGTVEADQRPLAGAQRYRSARPNVDEIARCTAASLAPFACGDVDGAARLALCPEDARLGERAERRTDDRPRRVCVREPHRDVAAHDAHGFSEESSIIA